VLNIRCWDMRQTFTTLFSFFWSRLKKGCRFRISWLRSHLSTAFRFHFCVLTSHKNEYFFQRSLSLWQTPITLCGLSHFNVIRAAQASCCNFIELKYKSTVSLTDDHWLSSFMIASLKVFTNVYTITWKSRPLIYTDQILTVWFAPSTSRCLL